MSQRTEAKQNAYLYSEDLLANQQYQTVRATISEVIPPNTLKSADNRSIDKWAVRFTGKEKMLVLAKTNASIIHHITGHPPGDQWVGHTIALQVRIVESFGDQVTAIRVMPPNGCMIRKSILKRLGTKAVWKPTEPQKSEE